jgi:hypothetical protein
VQSHLFDLAAADMKSRNRHFNQDEILSTIEGAGQMINGLKPNAIFDVSLHSGYA